MRGVLGVLAVVTLALGLGACAGPSTTPEGSCPMDSGCCKAEGKPMACDMKAGCACCSKGSAGGAAPQGHQH